jgi:hypothetical protein
LKEVKLEKQVGSFDFFLDNGGTPFSERYGGNPFGKAKSFVVSPNAKSSILKVLFWKKERSIDLEEASAGTSEDPLSQRKMLSTIHATIFHSEIIWRWKKVVKPIVIAMLAKKKCPLWKGKR